jgi:biopolymer transport protein ExbD
MASRGFLIRFIDIGLIVLFGFLMISDIEASSRVELADSRPDEQEEVAPEEERARAFVLVEIGGDGFFRVSDPAVGEAPTPVRGSRALEVELARRIDEQADAEVELVILIQPEPASIVQLTVDAMDAADRLGVAKSLRMDIEVAPPPPPPPDTASADSAAVGGTP